MGYCNNNFTWNSIECDYKIIYNDRSKKFYVDAARYDYPVNYEPERKPIAVMDPGEITFQTLYGLDHVIEFANHTRKYIMSVLKKIDDLNNKIKHKKQGTGKKTTRKNGKKVRKNRVNHYKRAIDRYQTKLKNFQTELHHKIAIYLCENYDRIMVSDFSSKGVSSRKRNLNVESKRTLGKLSHYKFRQTLLQKCEKYNCQYLEVNEAYTSKTCSLCGNVKDVKDERIYNCTNKKCRQIIGRDVNGAINILLKNNELVLA
jgi:IS605 OrfB family transposase